ncbi:MAG: hypothetical protein AVDCRST_MAG42-1837 [uncultured Chthoniobacterales bacterium]|uniref:Uncharacterized protein n=1 Tax=uncultured Chthoniobacterales bacterium TaxID=1836801 RepID=A0A6J4HY20_9BACT|nr:MAG: hypothetical protein AVDCRST_MAG42-1837 [uncultured Chthoniobacterales bacterium]
MCNSGATAGCLNRECARTHAPPSLGRSHDAAYRVVILSRRSAAKDLAQGSVA